MKTKTTKPQAALHVESARMGQGFALVSDEAVLVANVHADLHSEQKDAWATAHRFAASLDLLAILERIMYANDTGNCGASMGEAKVCEHYASLARAAIAAAKGA